VHRGISLLDIMSKLYEKVCANRIQALQAQLPGRKGIQDEQMRFNPNHQVDDAVHGLIEG
jgi:hypothetical protein